MEQAIKAMEERAQSRLEAAEQLQALAKRSKNGLVKEELLRGISRMLDQQLEFLLCAEKLKKRVLGMRAASAQGSLY